MTNKPVLRPEEVQGVLSGGECAADPGPQPYSLREPMAIPPAALEVARATMADLVGLLSQSLSGTTPVELGLDDLQQQTAAAALSALPPPPWIAGLARAENNGGLALALHPSVGLALVDMALGGPGTTSDDARRPTALESRVLQRLLTSAAAPIGDLLSETLVSTNCETGRLPSVIATPGETLAVGLLRFKIGEGHHTSLLLMTASLLLPESRNTEVGSARGPGPLARTLERVPLELRPVLPAGSVSFHDMMTARAGNVLRLDVAEGACFELRAEGQPVAHGHIVRKTDRSVFTISRMLGRPSSEERSEKNE